MCSPSVLTAAPCELAPPWRGTRPGTTAHTAPPAQRPRPCTMSTRFAVGLPHPHATVRSQRDAPRPCASRPGPTRRGRAAKHSVAAGDTGGPGHAVTATRRAAVRSNDTAESVTPARPCRSLSGAAGRAASEQAARAGTCVCVSVNFCASQNSILSNIEKCANKPYFRGRSKTSTRLGSPLRSQSATVCLLTAPLKNRGQ